MNTGQVLLLEPRVSQIFSSKIALQKPDDSARLAGETQIHGLAAQRPEIK